LSFRHCSVYLSVLENTGPDQFGNTPILPKDEDVVLQKTCSNQASHAVA